MPKHKISPYRVKLRQDHKTGMEVRTRDLWELDDLGNMNPGLQEYDNFIELVEDFLQDLREDGYINDTVKRALAATEIATGGGDFDSDPEARTIEAELTYGRYDRVADHTDKDVFSKYDDISPYENRRESERDRDTVAETRLHMLVHMPTSTNRSAFLVLHSYGRNSAKSRVQDALDRFINNKYNYDATPFALKDERRQESYKLEVETVAGSDLIDKLKSSKIVGFEVKKRDSNVPEYMQESTILGDGAKGSLHIEYTSDGIFSDIKTKNQSIWERIRNEKYPLAELVNDDPSRANAIIESPGDSNRKINITKDEVRMEKTIDSGELEYDSDGRVRTDIVGGFVREFINEKLHEIGASSLQDESLLK